MSDQQTTQLWDLIYGLLDEPEATRLQELITSDPAVARDYARVQQQAELLGRAAKLESPDVEFQVPAASTASSTTAAAQDTPVRSEPLDLKVTRRSYPSSPAAKAFRSILAVTAAGLVCVAAYAYFQPNSSLSKSGMGARRQALSSEFVRLIVTGPANLEADVTNTFQVRTTNIQNEPLSTAVEYRVYDRNGEIRAQDTVRTDTLGRYALALPPEVTTDQSRLEIEAIDTKSRDIMKTHIRVNDASYETHLSTDKPLYRPGEVVHFRSLTLSRFGWKDTRDLPVTFELLGPAGNPIPNMLPSGITQRGVGNGSFQILPGMPGGKYTILAKSPQGDFPTQEREFFIRDYRPPRLQKELEFTRDSYTTGDDVVADFAALRTEGGPVAGQPLTITATVDGTLVFESHDLKTSSDGTRQIRFQLPTEITAGDATLAVVVDDGGTRETIAKTIPINLGKVDVQFFPEGGELVAGLKSRVYFFASDPLGKPVHIEGQILDGQGNPVAEVTTTHEGRGVFELVGGDANYRLQITQPAGVTAQPPLPPVSKHGDVVMRTDGVLAPGEAVTVAIHSSVSDKPLVLAATCRGAAVGQISLVTESSQGRSQGEMRTTNATLQLPPEVDGVIRLTLYDHSKQPVLPVAERLIYRKPSRQLQLTLNKDDSEFTPGQTIKLVVSATDEVQKPRPAVLGVTVVDSGVLNLADEKRASMTTHFRLASEIEHPEDLEDIEFFVADDAASRDALDLLLGTQGWRRFVDASQIAQLPASSDAESIQAKNAQPGATDAPSVTEFNATEFPLVYDNFQRTRREFQRALLRVQRLQEVDIQWTGAIIFYGGAAILIVLMLLALMRLSGGVSYWLPMLGTATACLIVGGLWLGAEISENGRVVLTPFTQHGIRSKIETARLESPEPGRDANDMLGGYADPMDEEVLDQLAAGEVELLMADAGLGLFDKKRAAIGDFFANLNALQQQQGLADQRQRMVGQDRWFQGFADAEAPEFFLRQARRKRIARNEMRAFEEGDLAVGMGGGFGGIMEGESRFASVPLAYMYRQLEAAALAKDLDAVTKISSTIEASLAPFRFPVRQYAHIHKPTADDGVRRDFTETIYWHPLLITDERGRAEFEFALSDSITTFDVLLNGHGSGRIGTGRDKLTSRIPFSISPKLPFEVTAGDKIDLPLGINNDTNLALEVKTNIQTNDLLKLNGDHERVSMLDARQRLREFFPLAVTGETGTATVEFSAKAGTFNDGISKSIRVVPPGFPFHQAIAGQLVDEQEVSLTLPETWVPGSLKVSLTAYPSALADIRDGIQGIIREPHGCFEQASSSNYPNIWALKFMQDHDIADPAFTRRAKGFLKNGYSKLIGYECSQKGYEWFGGDPGHEALTAYGLMEFRDMAGVWDVDQEMVNRTAAWLMSRRDGEGGFLRNTKALDSFGSAPPDITNAYIVWALTEAGQEGLTKELNHVFRLAEVSDDPYLIALAACAAVNTNHAARDTLLEKLTQLQQADGHLQGTRGSITRSGGISLQIETTSLAAIAWLTATSRTGEAASDTWSVGGQQAIQWITANRSGGGGFGSTQGTVLALKALVLNAELNKQQLNDGALIMQLADGEIGRTEFSADQVQPIRLQGIGGSLQPGENQLKLSLTGENKMPFSLDVSYRTRKPNNGGACPLRLATRLASTTVKAGATVDLNIQVENTSGEGQPMATAIIGLPAGLEPRQEKLTELQDAGVFDYYEQMGRELIFYWRSLSPEVRGDHKIDFTIDVVAEVPGEFEGPASRVYLYYTSEEKHWNKPLQVNIRR